MPFLNIVGGVAAADLVLLVLPLELLVLCLRPGAVRTRSAFVSRALALAPGACLTLALRAALLKGPGLEVALFIALSLPAHLADVARRRL